MAKLNPQDMIEELRYDIKNKDPLKARIVLSYIDKVDKNTQKKLLFVIVQADSTFSIPLLAFLLSEYPQLDQKIPILKETLVSNILSNLDFFIELLGNPNSSEKKIYIIIAGEIGLIKGLDTIVEILLGTEDQSIIIACINTLGLLGDASITNVLTDYLYSGNREITTTAVKSLGQISSPTAMHRLAERMGTDNEIDMLILDIFSKVQDSLSLEKINESIQSHYVHIRTFAKNAMVTIGTKAVPLLTDNLKYDDPDLIIHSLNILGDIGDASAIMPIRKLLNSGPRDANIRFAAYEALSLLPLKKGAYILTDGLTDPVESVSLAAAKAIEKNYDAILTAGIKNLVKAKDEDTNKIIKAIINANTDKIFLSLVEEDYFQEIVAVYMPKAHPDTQAHFKELLIKEGYEKYASQIILSKEESDAIKIFAVDDSRMILNIFKSTLHELGFTPLLFEFPASALDALDAEKPDIILTDLNMPDITGIDLTEKIRLTHSKEDLPIIMVTTQNENNDNEAAFKAGVNKIIHKPFDADMIKNAISEFI